jgi:hypothetical protein
MKKVNGWWMQDNDEVFSKLVFKMNTKYAGLLHKDYFASYNYAVKFCRKHEVAIDCGAHIGTWSVEMSKKFKNIVGS